jgi:hypothetical protein
MSAGDTFSGRGSSINFPHPEQNINNRIALAKTILLPDIFNV